MSDKVWPLMSMGVTSYNSERTIAAALESCLAQTYPNFEVVVVDDGSSDGSKEIIERYASRFPDVIVPILNNANSGASHAFNRIIEAARGEYLCFNDDDDTSMPQRLAKTIEALKNSEGAGICFVDRYINKWGGDFMSGLVPNTATAEQLRMYTMDAICYHLDPDFYRSHRHLFAGVRSHGLKGSTGSGVMTIRTDIAREILFNEDLRRFYDTEFNLRAAVNGVSAINVPEPLLLQTVTTGDDKNIAIDRAMLLRIFQANADLFMKAQIVHPLVPKYIAKHKQEVSSPPIVSGAPEVSLVVTSYNCEDTISRCLASAVELDGDYEIIVVDDCSTDKTLGAVNAFRSPRLRVLQGKVNRGAGFTRNWGVKESRGEFVVFQDDDDIPYPNRLQDHVASIRKAEREYGGTYVSFCRFNHYVPKAFLGPRNPTVEYGPVIFNQTLSDLVWYVVVSHSRSRHLLPRLKVRPGAYALGTSLMGARREVFASHGFDEKQRRLQDIEFLVRFVKDGGAAVCTERVGVDIHSTASDDKAYHIVLENSRRLVRKHMTDFLRKFGELPDEFLEMAGSDQRRPRRERVEDEIWKALVKTFG